MGIKDLNAFLKEHTPAAVTNVHFNELMAEKRLPIDTSIYFYKFMYKNERFLESFFNQIAHLRQYNITPVYVFDGAPPPEKMEEIKKKKKKKKARKQLIKSEILDLKNEIKS